MVEDLLDAIWLRTSAGADLAITGRKGPIHDRPSRPRHCRGTAEFDVVFPRVDRPFGEDGTLQGFLERALSSATSGPGCSPARSDGQALHEARRAGRLRLPVRAVRPEFCHETGRSDPASPASKKQSPPSITRCT